MNSDKQNQRNYKDNQDVDDDDYDLHRCVFHKYFPWILGTIGIVTGTLLVLKGSNN